MLAEKLSNNKKLNIYNVGFLTIHRLDRFRNLFFFPQLLSNRFRLGEKKYDGKTGPEIIVNNFQLHAFP